MSTNSETKNNQKNIFTLVGQIVIKGEIKTLTGLHIGGTESSLSIGGIDSLVIRNATDGKPYIPGSSLKGKMRAILEKIYAPGGGELKSVGNSRIFKCNPRTYNKPDKSEGLIFHLFGVTTDDLGSKKKGDGKEEEEKVQIWPTRLIVRDANLSKSSSDILEQTQYVDLPYTQAKTEVVIDRITSEATPRTIERVPSGIIFDFEFVLNLYNPPDLENGWLKGLLDTLKEGMDLLENDYLGGMGSRGYGQIKFQNTKVEIKDYSKDKKLEEKIENTLKEYGWKIENKNNKNAS